MGDHATSARIASPVRSALVRKPRAPDSATSEPKSVPSRLEASTIAAGEPASRSRAATSKPSMSGSSTSRRTTSGASRSAAATPDSPSLAVPDDGEAVGLEHDLRNGPEGRMVVDDQDRQLSFGLGDRGDRLTDHPVNLLRRYLRRIGEGATRGEAASGWPRCAVPPVWEPRMQRGSHRPMSPDARSAAARSPGDAAGEVPCGERARRRRSGAAVPQRAPIAGTDAARGRAVGHVDDPLHARECPCSTEHRVDALALDERLGLRVERGPVDEGEADRALRLARVASPVPVDVPQPAKRSLPLPNELPFRCPGSAS